MVALELLAATAGEGPEAYVPVYGALVYVLEVYLHAQRVEIERRTYGVCGPGMNLNTCGSRAWSGGMYIHLECEYERERVWLRLNSYSGESGG